MSKKQAIFIKPQAKNVNRHTPRGMSELERSISQRGWIGAPTVAADGESFDGSARLETGAGLGFDYADPAIIDAPDDRAIIVRSRGRYPVIHMRADIPTADDDRAKLLALEANKIAADNLSFDPLILAEVAQEIDVSGLFSEDELAAALRHMPDDGEWGGALGVLPEGDRAPFQQMTFTLSDEQAGHVKDALDKARRMGSFVSTGNENGNGNALARVCEVFLGVS